MQFAAGSFNGVSCEEDRKYEMKISIRKASLAELTEETERNRKSSDFIRIPIVTSVLSIQYLREFYLPLLKYKRIFPFFYQPPMVK